jgi:hypothetical protein
MPIKPASAKIVDLDTAFDAAPVQSAEGPLVWATVTMRYALQDLSPSVTVRVPVPCKEQESADQRRDHALRCARQLIEHACRAVGVPAPDDVADEVLDAVVPTEMEGLAQELGLASPKTAPKRVRR